MKFAIASLAVLLALAGSAAAQVTPYDSLTVNTLVGGFGANNPSSIEGPPDGAQTTIAGSQFIAVMFSAGTQVVTFQKGKAMHVYWMRLTSDSAAADIEFVTLNPDNLALLREGPHIRVYENGSINIPQMTPITVPDTGYNALQISTAADTGATICWIDAISLIQAGFAAVGEPSVTARPLLTSYPNPFEHGSEAKVEITPAASGRGELVVLDQLGREIERIPTGQLSAGENQEVSVLLDHSGAFFARLRIAGNWVGAPLKLIAE